MRPRLNDPSSPFSKDEELAVFKKLIGLRENLKYRLCTNLYGLLCAQDALAKENEVDENYRDFSIRQSSTAKYRNKIGPQAQRLNDTIKRIERKVKHLINTNKFDKKAYELLQKQLWELVKDIRIYFPTLNKLREKLVREFKSMIDENATSEEIRKKFFISSIKCFRENLIIVNKLSKEYLNTTNYIIKRNMRLVSQRVGHLLRKNNMAAYFITNSNDLYNDLRNEGILGLIRAIDQFDPWFRGPGYPPLKFSTYAVLWIEQPIQTWLRSHNKQIPIPAHKLPICNAIKSKLINGKDPKLVKEEICKQFNITEDEYETLVCLTHRSVKNFSETEQANSDDSMLIQDTISDHRITRADDYLDKKLHIQRIRESLSKLPFRERYVILLKTGVQLGFELTLEDLTKIFHVTKERIRQIENAAITKSKKLLTEHIF